MVPRATHDISRSPKERDRLRLNLSAAGRNDGRHMKPLLTILVLVFALVQTSAADWLQFRGPNASGIAEGANPPVEWSASKNLRWKTEMPGPGSSSPIVVGNRIFVTCWSGYGDGSGGGVDDLKRHLVAIDRGDGKVVWQQTVPSKAREDEYRRFLDEHGYASHTPTSDGKTVFAFFGKSGVHAYALDGRKLWEKQVGTLSNNRRWGSAASLMLYDGRLIVNAADEARAILALDPKNGEEIWRAPGDSLELSFGTPIVVKEQGRESLVLGVPNEVWALNPSNGKLRWLAETRIPGNVSPSVVQGDGSVFVFGGYPQRGTVAIKTGGSRDVTSSHVRWRITKTTYVPTPIYRDGHLYFVNDQGRVLCLKAADGEVVYEERLPNVSGRTPAYASAVYANGNYYATTRRAGTFVIAADPKFKIVANNVIEGDRTQFNATPAISGNQIFLRSDAALYCFANSGSTQR